MGTERRITLAFDLVTSVAKLSSRPIAQQSFDHARRERPVCRQPIKLQSLVECLYSSQEAHNNNISVGFVVVLICTFIKP